MPIWLLKPISQNKKPHFNVSSINRSDLIGKRELDCLLWDRQCFSKYGKRCQNSRKIIH